MSDELKELLAERDQLRDLASDLAALIRRQLARFRKSDLTPEELAYLETLRARLRALVPAEAPMPEGIEGVARCKGCRVWVAWRDTPQNSKLAPFDIVDGVVTETNHFVTCPKRDQFRTKKKGAKA
ncbi:MAG TPA: hypothetical protein VGE07_00565 [Herpetosiphonaceae bacterium]